MDDFNRLPEDVAMALRLASAALDEGRTGAEARAELARIRDRYTDVGTVVTSSERGTDVVVLPGPATASADARAVAAVEALARPDLGYGSIVDTLRELDPSVLNLISDEAVARAAVDVVHRHWPQSARREYAGELARAAAAPLRAALAQLRHSGRLHVDQHDEEIVLQVDGQVVHSWIMLGDA